MRYPIIFALASVMVALAGAESRAADSTTDIKAAVTEAASQTEVLTAVADLQKWLEGSKHAKAWNAYLLTDKLQAELAKSGQADPATLAAILARYDSGKPGLEKRQFAKVRKALAAWHAQRVESNLPSRETLGELLKDQKDMAPKSEEEVSEARKQARLAVATLGKYLNAHGQRGKDWKRFLHWEKLERVLKSDAPEDKELRSALARFEADKDGLEMKQYRAVRDALRNYYYTGQARNLANLRTSLEKRVKGLPAEPQLQALLKDYGPETNHLGAVKVGAYIGEFERFHQKPTFVRSVRRHLSHPNLTAYISVDLVAAALGENVDERIKVQETILGTYVTGDADVTGRLDASLTPNETKGTIHLSLTGTTKSKTRGYNGPVTIYSRGVTRLEGATQINLSSDGLTHTPATGTAETKTTVEGLSTRRNGPAGRIIERAAWKRVGQSKSEAESIASERAAARLRERMDRQANETLVRANEDFASKFRDPLTRRDAFPRLLNVRSTDKAIEVLMQQASADQLAAPVPPASLERKNDMAVRLHESLLNNLAATRLGGETITDKSAAEAGQTAEQKEKLKQRINKQKERNRAERFAKMNDEEKKVEMARRAKADQDQSFSVTLAPLNPVSIELRKGNVKVTVRGTAFEGLEGRRFDEHPMSIWAVYRIELGKDGGLNLVMDNLDTDWGVMTTVSEYGGPAEAGAEILRAKLKARFGDIFTDLYRVELEPLVLPGKLQRAGRLAFKQAEAQQGWLTLAWDRVEKKDSTAKKVDSAVKR